MQIGKVKWYNRKKGYGFIVGEDGVDYYFHVSNVVMDKFVGFSPNENVNFEIRSLGEGKQEAVSVSSLDA